MRVGSSPSTSGFKSSIAAQTARVCHSSVASPQPYKPGWSVSTLTKIQLRMRAWQHSVRMSTIFIACQRSPAGELREDEVPLLQRIVDIGGGVGGGEGGIVCVNNRHNHTHH